MKSRDFSVFAVKEQGATYEDYAAVPERSGRFELLDGELLAMSPAPSTIHQLVSKELQKALYTCDAEYFILDAPIDVILSLHSTLQPDIVILDKRKQHLLTRRGIEGPPDIVVEILSTSSVERDRGKKMSIYAHYCVPEYWIVDIGNKVLEQYLLSERGQTYRLKHVFVEEETITSPNIQCATFNISSLFKEIPLHL